MASSCGFCNESCLRDNLLEQLIAGILDRAVVRKLLDLPNLDLETALGVCAASREAETKNVRFDPLAVVKVEQGIEWTSTHRANDSRKDCPYDLLFDDSRLDAWQILAFNS